MSNPTRKGIGRAVLEMCSWGESRTERPVESLVVAVAGSHGYICSDKHMIVELFDGVRKRIRTA